ncbi:MAG TPA: o-succinylbenzoate synthase [Bacteroidales bacterium]|nr:o-succinylbenzoate synthase [Bacteroidales bacterium]
MLQAAFTHKTFHFIQPAGTSRGVLNSRESWFIWIWHNDSPEIKGVGECGPLPGLSIDEPAAIQSELGDLCAEINNYHRWLAHRSNLFPSIRFGLETALNDIEKGGTRVFQQNDFTSGITGIPINGLIWMGSPDFMKLQIKDKISAGFRCIKIKVGAIDFKKELELIQYIRNEYEQHDIEIRVDANGAFSPSDAPEKLKELARYRVHSIEQPIKKGQTKAMAALCANSPIAVALDEELIGIETTGEQKKLLSTIKPHFLVLKPGLLGGFASTTQWAEMADKLGIKWWVTSALESNIGLNAIAQWTFRNAGSMHQGLGTGQLFTNNVSSPLVNEGEKLYYNPELTWNLEDISHG